MFKGNEVFEKCLCIFGCLVFFTRDLEWIIEIHIHLKLGYSLLQLQENNHVKFSRFLSEFLFYSLIYAYSSQ